MKVGFERDNIGQGKVSVNIAIQSINTKYQYSAIIKYQYSATIQYQYNIIMQRQYTVSNNIVDTGQCGHSRSIRSPSSPLSHIQHHEGGLHHQRNLDLAYQLCGPEVWMVYVYQEMWVFERDCVCVCVCM